MEILRYLPKSWISYLVGKLAHTPLPIFLSTPIILWFVNRYKVDLSEVKNDISTFRSLGKFFIRELKPTVRPIQTEPVSPADSFLRSAGIIPESGILTQIKSLTYATESLLGSKADADIFSDGLFFNFYLSPKDYHRVHSPVSGIVTKVTHIPGALWPVNDWSLYSIKNLFCVNERVITYIKSDFGLVAVVMVGATNVGRISLSFCDLVSNCAPWRPKVKQERVFLSDPVTKIAAGEHLGTFHLGSTVVLFLSNEFKKHFNASDFNFESRSINFGQSLRIN
jgi:phosphatidylserine decarboxylase